jgi:glycosyltransferase involved in cell wall biosynthesis
MSNTPKVSIVTVVYNAELLIERTLRSILQQTYQNLEFVIVDGLSTDATLERVAAFNDPRIHVHSERDKGIYDAMNKGQQRATGEYIMFINAGDELYDHNTIAMMLATAPHADVYYGNTAVVNDAGEILGERRLSPPEQLSWRSLRYGMCVSHQSIMARRSLAPDYNLKYKISADIDWTIRLLKNANHVVNCHQFVSKFLEGGVSTSRRKQGLKERFQIMMEHYGIVTTIMSHVYICFRYVGHLFTKRTMT